MRISKFAPIIALLVLAATFNAGAQCKSFAKTVCLPQLAAYTHDGNYHAAVLVEGEEAELYKTFYSDMEYRVAICGEDKLPAIQFDVFDASNNLLYSNKDSEFAKTWDFKLQSSQQLKIIIKVKTASKSGEVPASGCVSIMFGFKVAAK
jgi:hypothetical protein